ncbi:unnamed protein product [Cuscuta epithymum]|uniref:CUE domain-containing protein n=1 Tax=Cuscuta epithymum TaxID=186058 RepID=A0AAV0CHZ9_9ASTE|nr:unnamed protein product [Cuscuta epithymum]
MSSNRYSSQNRNQGSSSSSSSNNFARPKQKFMPKKDIQSDQTPFTSNSQQSKKSDVAAAAASGGSGSGESASRLKMSEMGEWVSSVGQGGNFVDYLPQDEAVATGLGADKGGLDPVESQRVVDLLNRELSRLLKLSPKDFWREVSSDTSLHSFLESFLKFRSRWYDFPYHGPKGIVAGVIVGEFELSRRVFMTLYRISSSRDPGAKAADTVCQKDYSALLQEKKLLSLPKLLEISAIYGHENEDLTRILIVNAINAQPWIHDDLTEVISHFLSIVHTMYERCSSSIEVLFSSVGCQEHGHTRLLKDYLEVMDFINDGVVSMDAFVNAYNQSAVYISIPVDMSHGNEEMLTTLARLHDSLLPSLERGFRLLFASKENNGSSDISSSSMHSDVYLSLKMLSTRIVNFGWKLLYLCYLRDEAFDGSYLVPVGMKMFPASVEDPVIRTDILIQIVRDINGIYLQSLEAPTKGTFLQSIEENHKVMSKIGLLRDAGWFTVDDDQFRFLSGIFVKSVQKNIRTTPSMPSSGTNSTPQVDEDAVIVESKISQIKDLFPEYGKGFLAACLEVYNQDPEEVIQRILEGTLHKDLQSLDISLEETPKPKSSLPSSLAPPKDKGKGKLFESSEPAPPIKHTQIGSSSNSSSTSSVVVGRYVRKTGSDLPDATVLNSRSEADLARTAALASQFEEYEDEYDDSFDDLGVSVAGSALEETENIDDDKLNSGRGGKSSGFDNNASNSKWNKKPQFYVKDGKNYSYKVEGSIAVNNYDEASLVNQAQKELIHGLGRGGNLPMGAVKRIADSIPGEQGKGGGRGQQQVGRGFGRGHISSSSSGPVQKPNDDDEDESGVKEWGRGGGRGGNFRGGGGGQRGRGRNHYKKDRAMKKHMAGVTGHW